MLPVTLQELRRSWCRALTILHLSLQQAVHEAAPDQVLSDVEVGGGRIQEVRDGLVVNLQEAAAAVVTQAVSALQGSKSNMLVKAWVLIGALGRA